MRCFPWIFFILYFVLVPVLTSQYWILMSYNTTAGPLVPLLPSANQVGGGGGTVCTWWKSNDDDDNGGDDGGDEAMLMMMCWWWWWWCKSGRWKRWNVLMRQWLGYVALVSPLGGRKNIVTRSTFIRPTQNTFLSELSLIIRYPCQ